MVLLRRKELLEALAELDHELGLQAIRAEVFIVGGAAMAIAYDVRRSTVDVDAVFAPAAEVRVAARRVAEKLGLEPDWLNDGAKAFMPISSTVLPRCPYLATTWSNIATVDASQMCECVKSITMLSGSPS